MRSLILEFPQDLFIPPFSFHTTCTVGYLGSSTPSHHCITVLIPRARHRFWDLPGRRWCSSLQIGNGQYWLLLLSTQEIRLIDKQKDMWRGTQQRIVQWMLLEGDGNVVLVCTAEDPPNGTFKSKSGPVPDVAKLWMIPQIVHQNAPNPGLLLNTPELCWCSCSALA